MNTATSTRRAWRAVHGVLLLDKPAGLTSQRAVQLARRLFAAEKAGHTGTLDPLATGLLPIAFGAATKFSHAGLEADKAYRATIALGTTTATGDAEGEVVERRTVACDAAAVERALAGLRGRIVQTPPMHSALKHAGKPLYAWARAGVEVERAPRDVVIHRLELVERQGDTLVVDVVCSKGTYVRTLADAVGAALGCGAHLAALRRTASGALRLDDAVTLDALEAMTAAERQARLLDADALVASWPLVRLPADEAARLLAGNRRRLEAPDAEAVRVYGPGRADFLGSASLRAGELIPLRLLSPAEVAALRAPDPSPVP